jgi:hypothetical protein
MSTIYYRTNGKHFAVYASIAGDDEILATTTNPLDACRAALGLANMQIQEDGLAIVEMAKELDDLQRKLTSMEKKLSDRDARIVALTVTSDAIDDAIEKCIAIVEHYRGVPSLDSVSVHRNFATASEKLAELRAAHARGDIPEATSSLED